MADSQLILERVRDLISEGATLMEAPESLRVDQVRHQRESIIYGCSFSQSKVSRRILVKVFLDGTEMARSQFDTLQILWPLFSKSCVDLAVPRPLGFFPDFSAVAMEEIPGISLMEHFKRLRWRVAHEKSWAKLVVAVRKSGQWLGRFHGFDSRAENQCLDVRDIMDGAKMEAEQSIEFGMRPDFVAEVLDRLEGQLHQFGREQFRNAFVHGDFKLDNIIISDVCVAGIDIAIRYHNVIYRDLSSFCNSIELLRLDPFNILFSPHRLAALKNEFLSGYFGDESYSTEPLALFQVIGLLAKYVYLCKQYSQPLFHKVYLTPFFTSRIRDLLRLTIQKSKSNEVKR